MYHHLPLKFSYTCTICSLVFLWRKCCEAQLRLCKLMNYVNLNYDIFLRKETFKHHLTKNFWESFLNPHNRDTCARYVKCCFVASEVDLCLLQNNSSLVVSLGLVEISCSALGYGSRDKRLKSLYWQLKLNGLVVGFLGNFFLRPLFHYYRTNYFS